MKKRTTLIIGLLGIITQVASAQNYTFKILASNGKSLVKGEKSEWQSTKTGGKLFIGDVVQLLDGGYLGLVHSSGKTIELKDDSIYNISKLSSNLLSNAQNMVSKYADYVMSKMTPEQKEENRRLYAGVTGSVERSIFDTDIYIYLPKSVSVLNDKVIFRWSSNLTIPIYNITIKNIFGEVIHEGETSDNFYTLDFKDDKFKEHMISNLLIIQVVQKNNKVVASQSVSVRQIDESNVEELRVSLDQLKANVGRESSLTHLILAEFYEEQKLTLDAITSYENAIKLSPDVKYFQDVYDEFLIRHTFKSPAEVDAEG
jgi:hypothetical protein